MTSALALLTLAAPGAFLATTAAAVQQPGRQPRSVERAGTIASWFGVVIATASGAVVAARGLVESPTIGWRGLGLSIRLDSLSTVMLTMISLLAIIIFRYSCTYLDGDERHGAFLGRLAATIASVEVLVISGNLALLVLTWVTTSLALHQLLLFYPQRPRAQIAARKKFIAARIGDTMLIAGAALLYHHVGTGNLERIFVSVDRATATGWALGSVGVAGLCLVGAALLKSAQFPTHGWLVEVMETPTPVSALLHAGILNAGPFLAIRMAYVLDRSSAATTLLIIVGGFTALFASVVLLTQPTVKVSLGYSSAAHMGFMLMVCGMGAYPAALLHLVAHSFYKAHAFLSSGSVIDEKRASGVRLPGRLGSPIRVAGSLVVATGIYLALAVAWGVDLTGDPVVLALGAILVMGTTQIVAPALDSTGSIAGTLRAGLLALLVTTSFFTLESGAHHLLEATVPTGGARATVQLIAIACVLAAFLGAVGFQIFEPARTSSRRQRALAVHLRNGLYANAWFDRAVGALKTPTTAMPVPRITPPIKEFPR